jgi:hypothetical protein
VGTVIIKRYSIFKIKELFAGVGWEMLLHQTVIPRMAPLLGPYPTQKKNMSVLEREQENIRAN